MNDDWRLRVEFHEDGVAHALSERLNAAEIEHDLEKSFADRVIVWSTGPRCSPTPARESRPSGPSS